jgi:hypothetical protein
MAASRQIHIWLGGLGEIIQHGARNPTIDTYRFRFEFRHVFLRWLSPFLCDQSGAKADESICMSVQLCSRYLM